MRDVARDWAQQAAAPREARRGRDDRRETFGRNVGGSAEPASPLHRRGAQGGGAAPAVAMPNGRHLRTELPGQTWDGNRLDLGEAILDAGWSDHSPVSGPSNRWTMPAGGSYWDYDVVLEIGGTAAESGQSVDITLKVDGETRRTWTDVWVTDNLHLEYRIGTLDKGSAVTLEHTGGDPLTILGGQASMQLVDRQKAQVTEAVEPWTKVMEGSVWGLHYDGTSWWTTEGAAGLTVSERDDDFAETDSFEAGFGAQVRGVTFDGTDLWVAGDEKAGSNDDVIFRYSTAGTQLQEINFGLNKTLSGGAFDGTDLWIAEDSGNVLYRYTTGGSEVESFSLGPGTWRGLDYHDGRLYLVEGGAAVVKVLDPADASEVDEIDVSGANGSPSGVFITDDGTLYITSAHGDTMGVWRRTEPVG